MNTIKVKLNQKLGGYQKGTILKIGSKSCPMNKFWRNRLTDSEIDNCLSIMVDDKNISPPKKLKKIKEV